MVSTEKKYYVWKKAEEIIWEEMLEIEEENDDNSKTAVSLIY